MKISWQSWNKLFINYDPETTKPGIKSGFEFGDLLLKFILPFHILFASTHQVRQSAPEHSKFPYQKALPRP